MKASETLIAWNAADHTPLKRDAPPGSVAVGPVLEEGDGDWTSPYACTGGAAWMDRRKLSGAPQHFHVLTDWYRLVYTYGIDPYIAHRAFLLIDEYQAIIKRMGCGPDRDESGHDPNVGYGRVISSPPPKILIRQWGRGIHFWPQATLATETSGNGAKIQFLPERKL